MKPNDASPTPESVKQMLLRLGHFILPWDMHRVTVPLSLRRRLGHHLALTWICSPWQDRVRLVLDVLWEPYLQVVGTEIRDPALADRTLFLLNQASRAIVTDTRNRWDIPVELVSGAGLSNRQNAVVLIVNRFWLELLTPETWGQSFVQTLRSAHESLSHPDEAPISADEKPSQ